jgi:hypothetical protein
MTPQQQLIRRLIKLGEPGPLAEVGAAVGTVVQQLLRTGQVLF